MAPQKPFKQQVKTNRTPLEIALSPTTTEKTTFEAVKTMMAKEMKATKVPMTATKPPTTAKTPKMMAKAPATKQHEK